MTSVRTPPRRGLEHPDEGASRHEARWRFLQAVHRVQPRVSGDLMGEPLDVFRPILEQAIARLPVEHRDTWQYRGVDPAWSWFKHADAGQEQQYPGSLRLCDLLLRWGRMWRLEDEWLLDSAVETLADYCIDNDQPTLRPLSYSGLLTPVGGLCGGDELRFTFDPDDAWTPTIESWTAAKARLTASFNRALRTYQHRVEAMYQADGFVSPRGSRLRGGDHDEWLGWYVVERQTYIEIADSASAGVTSQAVSAAVKEKAELIGLTLPRERQKSAS